MTVHLVMVSLSDQVDSQWEYSGNLGPASSVEQDPEF
jgi:hypothetical protein